MPSNCIFIFRTRGSRSLVKMVMPICTFDVAVFCRFMSRYLTGASKSDWRTSWPWTICTFVVEFFTFIASSLLSLRWQKRKKNTELFSYCTDRAVPWKYAVVLLCSVHVKVKKHIEQDVAPNQSTLSICTYSTCRTIELCASCRIVNCKYVIVRSIRSTVLGYEIVCTEYIYTHLRLTRITNTGTTPVQYKHQYKNARQYYRYA